MGILQRHGCSSHVLTIDYSKLMKNAAPKIEMPIREKIPDAQSYLESGASER